MNITIIRNNKHFKVIIEDDSLQHDLVYKTYPINFKIDQNSLDTLLQTVLGYKNGIIKSDELDDFTRSLTAFINIQNNLFLLNNSVVNDKLDIILSFIQTSKNILVPSPRKTTLTSVQSKFASFIETHIKITNDKTHVLTSTEIKTPFFTQENIIKDWQSYAFKELNVELNNVLKTWSQSNNIETKTINKIRMPIKYYYGVVLNFPS